MKGLGIILGRLWIDFARGLKYPTEYLHAATDGARKLALFCKLHSSFVFSVPNQPIVFTCSGAKAIRPRSREEERDPRDPDWRWGVGPSLARAKKGREKKCEGFPDPIRTRYEGVDPEVKSKKNIGHSAVTTRISYVRRPHSQKRRGEYEARTPRFPSGNDLSISPLLLLLLGPLAAVMVGGDRGGMPPSFFSFSSSSCRLH